MPVMFIQPLSRITSLAGVAVLALALLALPGCGGVAGDSRVTQAQAPLPVRPARPDLTTPEAAVRSYLDWTSYAYAMANSEVATMTMSPDEEVRVNSYIQLNKERNRTIDQTLTAFELRGKPSGENTVTVGARESWRYRYVSIDRRTPGPATSASYVTTYTVVKIGGDWVVGSVEASATTPVK